MDIKVYDESGKVIRIVPMYQAGGVIPQYTPTETTMYRPQASANTMLDMSQRNLEFQNQRQVQQQSFDLQRDQQFRQSYQFAMQQRANQAREERLNRQLDLQNERFKQEVLQFNSKILDETISMDDDMFLPRDRVAIDQVLEGVGLGDEDVLNNTDILNDSETAYKMKLKKRSILNAQKNALTNKRMWDESAKELEKIGDVEKRAGKLSELGYLDEQSYSDYIKAYNNLQQKRQDWGNGKADFDMANDPDYQLIQKYQPLIDDAEMKNRIDLKNKMDQAEYESTLAKIDKQRYETEKSKQDLEFEKEMAPYEKTKKMTEAISQISGSFSDMSAINSGLTPDKQIDFTDPTKLTESIGKLTKDDWEIIRKNLETIERQKASKGQKLDIDEEILKAKLEGNEKRVDELLELKSRMTRAEDKNATINYNSNTDSSGTYSEDKKGNKNYGGFIVDETNEPISVTFGGTNYTVETTGENKGKVKGVGDVDMELGTAVGDDGRLRGYIKLKGDSLKNLNWLMGKYRDWGSIFTNEELDEFPDSEYAPVGTKYEDGYLWIPADEIAPPSSGAGSYNSPGSSVGASSGIDW